MIGAELEWGETKGAGVKVAVLDTGRPRHKDVKVVASANFAGTADDYDYNGHASHVCGTICANGSIFGVAPEVELYTAKVLDDQGSGSDEAIANGIYWSIQNGVDVINMSLGAPNVLPKTYQAIKEATSKGIIVICAAGNSGEYGLDYPGKHPETIAVAAVDINKARIDMSSIGPDVEVASAGDRVFSTWVDGQYATLEGTSMATPHIAGAVALLQAKAKIRYGKKLSLAEIRTLLHMYSEDVGEKGRDSHYGFGVFSFGRLAISDSVRSEDIIMQLNNNTFWVGGKPQFTDVAPVAMKGRTMVPIRVIAEAFGKVVAYEEKGQYVIIRDA